MGSSEKEHDYQGRSLAPSPSLSSYRAVVLSSMSKLLGGDGASAILFYTGEADPKDFDVKLRKIFGAGADIILASIDEEIKKTNART